MFGKIINGVFIKFKMSTRSRIAVKIGEKYKSIYCHFDGYPSGVGVILNKYYTNKPKIMKLINLGNISSLGPEIGTKHRFSDAPYNETTAFKRDGGEKNTSAETSGSIDELEYLTLKTDGEYLYVWENNKWGVYKI